MLLYVRTDSNNGCLHEGDDVLGHGLVGVVSSRVLEGVLVDSEHLVVAVVHNLERLKEFGFGAYIEVVSVVVNSLILVWKPILSVDMVRQGIGRSLTEISKICQYLIQKCLRLTS